MIQKMNNSRSSQVASAKDVDLPPTHKSKVDSKGFQIVTSYRANPSNASSQLIKTVTKNRVNYVKQVREAKEVAERRTWEKFGQAALDEDTSNVTIQSRDDVFMEDPNADLQEEDPTKSMTVNLNAFWAKQKQRHLERKYNVDTDAAEGDANQPREAARCFHRASNNDQRVYAPPSQRDGGAGSARKTKQRTDDLKTIRVTNISENTTEVDLQYLFQPFGRISRVYLAKDKNTMISRGFAFVSFVHTKDAARAMEKLQGFGYDHLILKLEWARPKNAPNDPGWTEYRSGYGKALAQDTKETVSYYASNLTNGVR